MPLLGGCHITSLSWAGPSALRVRFTSTHSFHHQLYAGRKLLGETVHPDQREIIGSVKPSHWPQFLWLVALQTGELGQDFGASLPPRPYNVVRIQFDAESWPSDADVIEVTSSPLPDEEVDENNVIARLLYRGDRSYSIETPPLPGSGAYAFEIAGRDNRPGGGNLGTVAEAEIDLLAHPPDVAKQSSGKRFELDVDAGAGTLTVTLPGVTS